MSTRGQGEGLLTMHSRGWGVPPEVPTPSKARQGLRNHQGVSLAWM